MDEKNGGPLSVLHVSKRGIFRFGFQILGETLLGVLLGLDSPLFGPTTISMVAGCASASDTLSPREQNRRNSIGRALKITVRVHVESNANYLDPKGQLTKNILVAIRCKIHTVQ